MNLFPRISRFLRRQSQILLLSMLALGLAFALPLSQVSAAANTVVTPNNPDGWQPMNVRSDATVGITTNQPRGDAPNNLGSLEFTTNTVTNGQDKADYVKYWGVVNGRTLGNISALSYEFYRASTSTTSQHLVPAFRLAYSTNETPAKTGYLIWENVYNGGSTSTPVPIDQWISKDILPGNFWMRAFGPGRTIEKYDVTLAQWASGYTYGTSQPLDANTNIIGIEVGVGSGWGGTFRGFVDNVAISFNSDSVTANFEPNPVVVQCTTDCYVDDDTGSDANGGTSFADAKKTIQAGVNQVSSGGTVHVKDGVYDEAITVNKPLTLEGIQHDVLAKGRPGPEAIIKLSADGQTPLTINASNVIVNGFTFDMIEARTPWAITALNLASYSNLSVKYNVFTGNPGTGDPNQDAGGAYLQNTINTLIEGNFFDRLGSHAIFMAASSDGTIYRNNDSLRNALSNFSAHVGQHVNTLVENNRAVEDSLIVFKTDKLTIKNNSYTATATNSSRVYLGGGDTNVTIDKNTFTDMRAQAIQIFDAGFGYGANSDVTITNNSIPTNVANQLAAGGPWSLIDLRSVAGTNMIDGNMITLSGSFAGGATGVHGMSVRGSGSGPTTISNNELNGGSVVSTSTPPNTGVLIRSNAPTYGQLTNTTININNNIIKNFSNGVAVFDFVANTYGGLDNTVTLKANLNSITGNSANGVITGANDPTLDAERNWWGSNTGPQPTGSGDRATGSVDYDPWLCSGQDTSSAVGFQPNSQTSPCTPPTGTLTVTKYNDQNGNGLRDNGEPGLNGWTISVKQGATTITSGSTDTNGNVTFSNVAVGEYTVCETLQSGWQNTDPSNGSGCKTATVTANNTTTVLLGNKATPPSGPAPAQPGKIYAVANGNPDKGKSQFYTIQNNVATALGSPHNLDFEDVAINPENGAIYASTGGDGSNKGYIYRVDGVTGAVTLLGPSGFKDGIMVLKFRASDNTLWGWSEGKGLVLINQATGAGTLIYKKDMKIEGMAWTADGKLYMARDKMLYQYDPATGKTKDYAKNLPKGSESLDIKADGTLVGGAYDKKVMTFTYNIVTKSVTSGPTVVTTTYKSIEGIAVPRS